MSLQFAVVSGTKMVPGAGVEPARRLRGQRILSPRWQARNHLLPLPEPTSKVLFCPGSDSLLAERRLNGLRDGARPRGRAFVARGGVGL